MNKPKSKCETKSKRRFKCRNGNYGWMGLFERLIFKITSGRFILVATVAFCFAYLACTGILPVERVMEVVFVVMYAYFTKKREDENKKREDENDES